MASRSVSKPRQAESSSSRPTRIGPDPALTFPPLWWLILAAGVGFGIGLLALQPSAWALVPPNGTIEVTRAFLSFRILMALQVALWFAVAVPFAALLYRDRRSRSIPDWLKLISISLVIACCTLVPNIAGGAYWGEARDAFGSYFPEAFPRISVLESLGVIAVVPPLVYLLMIDEASSCLASRDLSHQVTAIVALRRGLQMCLGALSAMLVALIVVLDALRTLANALYPTGEIPPTGVTLFGLYLTLMLALVYIPAFTRLGSASRQVVESASPLGDPTPPRAGDTDAWKAAYDRRADLETLLGLNSSALDSFKTYLVVLAPFLSGVLGVTLPFSS